MDFFFLPEDASFASDAVIWQELYDWLRRQSIAARFSQLEALDWG